MGNVDSKFETWVESTDAFLDCIKHLEPNKIPIVAEELRKWKEEAYEPKVVSIGPRYKGRTELLPMEQIKWQCMKSLLLRTEYPRISLRDCMKGVLELDTSVRASYREEIKLDKYNLATIMVFDGCFLLELLISASGHWNSTLRQPYVDISLRGAEVGKKEVVLIDLMLVENQIPLFILGELFRTLFPNVENNIQNNIENDIENDIQNNIENDIENDIENNIENDIENNTENDIEKNINEIIGNMALKIFGYSQYTSSNSTSDPTKATHFVELVHSCIRKNYHRNQQFNEVTRKQVKLNCCATRLEAAGIRIRPKLDGIQENSVVSYVKQGFDFNIEFRDRTLEISSLHITSTAETKWRNFIAWEDHRKKSERSRGDDNDDDDDDGVGESEDVITFSTLILNDLICCESDVQLLKTRGIIVDHLSMSNHGLIDLFGSITNGVDRDLVDSTDYSNIIHDLNTFWPTNCVVLSLSPRIAWHYLSRFSEWFLKFLRRGYNFTAAFVTLVTFIQVFYAVLSYHLPN